jgi:hypothetical protein
VVKIDFESKEPHLGETVRLDLTISRGCLRYLAAALSRTSMSARNLCRDDVDHERYVAEARDIVEMLEREASS